MNEREGAWGEAEAGTVETRDVRQLRAASAATTAPERLRRQLHEWTS
jgi:hypothetical protein